LELALGEVDVDLVVAVDGAVDLSATMVVDST